LASALNTAQKDRAKKEVGPDIQEYTNSTFGYVTQLPKVKKGIHERILEK